MSKIHDQVQIQNICYWALYGDIKMANPVKECFGEQCKDCKDIFMCKEHWGCL